MTGRLFIEGGRLKRQTRWGWWVPDGLHVWFASRGVHLWWGDRPHIEFDRDPRWRDRRLSVAREEEEQ